MPGQRLPVPLPAGCCPSQAALLLFCVRLSSVAPGGRSPVARNIFCSVHVKKTQTPNQNDLLGSFLKLDKTFLAAAVRLLLGVGAGGGFPAGTWLVLGKGTAGTALRHSCLGAQAGARHPSCPGAVIWGAQPGAGHPRALLGLRFGGA